MSSPESPGFCYPRTATGQASLLPSPRWCYSGDLLTVEYRTEPGRVAALLPEPLRPAGEDSDAVALIWADWQSGGASSEELLGRWGCAWVAAGLCVGGGGGDWAAQSRLAPAVE